MELDALIAVDQAADRLITRAVACLAATDQRTMTPSLIRALPRRDLIRALTHSARRDLTQVLALRESRFTRLLLGFAAQLEDGWDDRLLEAKTAPSRENGLTAEEPSSRVADDPATEPVVDRAPPGGSTHEA
jgi:hypothetical protein